MKQKISFVCPSAYQKTEHHPGPRQLLGIPPIEFFVTRHDQKRERFHLFPLFGLHADSIFALRKSKGLLRERCSFIIMEVGEGNVCAILDRVKSQ